MPRPPSPPREEIEISLEDRRRGEEEEETEETLAEKPAMFLHTELVTSEEREEDEEEEHGGIILAKKTEEENELNTRKKNPLDHTQHTLECTYTSLEREISENQNNKKRSEERKKIDSN